MDNLWTYIAFILLGVVVIAVMIWVIWKFSPWALLLRKGVLVEGRIEAHHSRKKWDGDGYSTSLSLTYSYDCNETQYCREEVVEERTYYKLKEGDSVKVRCLPDDPTIAELEASAFITLMRRLMEPQDISDDSHKIFPERWKGD